MKELQIKGKQTTELQPNLSRNNLYYSEYQKKKK